MSGGKGWAGSRSRHLPPHSAVLQRDSGNGISIRDSSSIDLTAFGDEFQGASDNVDHDFAWAPNQPCRQVDGRFL